MKPRTQLESRVTDFGLMGTNDDAFGFVIFTLAAAMISNILWRLLETEESDCHQDQEALSIVESLLCGQSNVYFECFLANSTTQFMTKFPMNPF